MGDLIPDDPIPDDPPALEPVIPGLPQVSSSQVARPETDRPETAGPGPPATSRFASKGSLHLRTAGKALVNWWRAVTIQGLCVALLWLIGLLLLHVPLAPLWALIAGLMTAAPARVGP